MNSSTTVPAYILIIVVSLAFICYVTYGVYELGRQSQAQTIIVLRHDLEHAKLVQRSAVVQLCHDLYALPSDYKACTDHELDTVVHRVLKHSK